VQDVATVVVEPGCEASITASGDIAIVIQRSEELSISTKVDPIFLSIFSHRFMGIAEQMGRTLQRTSVSVNIKERLDFSCALFDALGGLVANAPHLPVHLGAMSEAVRYQIKYWGADLEEGDVLVSNHPQLAGGSHLPDITVITPIYKYDTCMRASMMMMMMMRRYIQLLSLDSARMHACISPSSGTIVLPSSSLREVTMLMWGE
jgi:5-oxoprolinase (ATP-hydrolysing)